MAKDPKAKPQISMPSGTPDPKKEIGAPGLEIYGGHVSEEFLRELSGLRGMKMFREMADNSATIGAILFAIRMLLRQADWEVRPASPKPNDEEAAEFLRTCMNDMRRPWGAFIDDVMSMITYGFSVHEIVYKRRSGRDGAPFASEYDDQKIGWGDFAPRRQTTVSEWVVDENGRDLLGLWQQAPPNWQRVFIPGMRMLLFRPSAFVDNPEGRSVLRNAYRSYYLQKNIETFESIGIERDLVGMPVVKIPAAIIEEGGARFQTYKNIVTRLRNNEQTGVVLPAAFDEHGNSLYDLQLLSVGSRRSFDTNAIINRHDQRIAMSVLADFILIGHEHTGSFALASTKTELFATALGTWLDAIEQVLNRYAVPRLFALNPEFRVDQYPKFCHLDVEAPDLKELGDFISALAGAGMPLFPDHELESHLKRVAGLPVTEPEDLMHEDRSEDPRIPEEPAPPSGAPPPPSSGAPPAEEPTPPSSSSAKPEVEDADPEDSED